MLQLFPKLMIGLLAVNLFCFALASDKIIVLNTGQTIGIDGDYTIEGDNIYFKLGNGKTSVLPLSKIDLEKTEQRNQQIASGKTTAADMIAQKKSYKKYKGRNFQGLQKVVVPEAERKKAERRDKVAPDVFRDAIEMLPREHRWIGEHFEKGWESGIFSFVLIAVLTAILLSNLIYLFFYFFIITVAITDRFFLGMSMLVTMVLGLTSYIGWIIGAVSSLASFVLVVFYILTQCHGSRLKYLTLLFLPVIVTLFGTLLLVLTFWIAV